MMRFRDSVCLDEKAVGGDLSAQLECFPRS